MAFDHNHSYFNEVLKESVLIIDHQALVDYAQIKKKPDNLIRYTETLSSMTNFEFNKFSKDQKLAFLINAYNAFTIKLIVDNYPVKSIKDIGSFFSTPWKIEFINLLGKKIHLDHLEHTQIRSSFNNPKIHFALNCASLGCPNIQKVPFTATNFDELLDKAVSDFLLNPHRNIWDKEKKTLSLSKIFKWYQADFQKNNESILQFIQSLNLYDGLTPENISEISIKYLDYDWNLNDRK